MSDLQNKLDALIAAAPAPIGVYARHLTRGEEVAVKAEQTFPTLSAGKVFVLLVYAEQIAAGKLEASERLGLKAEDILPGTGALRYCAPGLQPTLSDLAYLMISHSDNVATNLLLGAVGGVDGVNQMLDRFGLKRSQMHSPLMRGDFCTATPRDLAEVYALLAEPQLYTYDPKAAKLALSILCRHQDVEGLSRFLPWSPHATDFGVATPLSVFSKSGQFPGSFCEAGLFLGQQEGYILAVMSKGWPGPSLNSASEGLTLLAQVGKLVYGCWS